jgi:PAS domain S-box-containing protein
MASEFAPTADAESTLIDGEDRRSQLPPPESEFLPLIREARQAHRIKPNALAARWCLGGTVAMALMLLVGLWGSAGALSSMAHKALMLSCVALMAASVAAMFVPRAREGLAVTAVFVAAALLLTLTAAAFGNGASAPGLGLLGLLVASLCLVAGVRSGVVLALVSVVAVLMLEFGRAWLPLAAPMKGVGGALAPLVPQLLVIAIGLVCGFAFTRIVARHVEAADERELRFAGLLSIAADAYWEIDAQLRVVAVHDRRDVSMATLLPELVGQLPWELPQFGCDAETLDLLQADLETRVPFRELVVRWRSRSGATRHFNISGEPRFNKRGQFRGYWGVAREITAHVQARQALIATESRYMELFSRIPTPLVLHRGSLVIDANPAAVQLFGYADLQSMLGRDVLENYESGDSRERGRRRLEQIETMASGDALPVADFRLRSRQGRRIAVRATGVPIDADGGPAVLSIYVDDTERRRAEEAVRRSEALLSHLVATSPDVITLTDLATGRYAMVNHTFERVTGYSAADVVGKSSLELGIWADPSQREAFVTLVRERGSAREMPCDFVTKDGTVTQLLLSGAVFAMDRRTYLVINGRDITAQERSRLERDAILQNASIGIAVTRDQRFVVTNPRFEQMFGYEEGALIGQSGAIVWPSTQSYAEVSQSIGPRLARGELVELEHLVCRRDGSTFVARTLSKAIDPGRTLLGGTMWIVEDVTERRQVGEALARARDQAEAASRAKSAFLANTSHELRTPLNGMLGLAQLAREADIAPDKRQHYLDQIAENARALAAIISDVLDLSKIEAGKLELESTAFDLPELLSTLRQAYGALATARGLELRFELDASLFDPSTRGAEKSHVQGDPLRVRQILSNYLANALKFTERGTVTLLARREGERVRVEVQDSGPGIEEAAQARLFQPFTQGDESTTRRFGGTGLGLSICRELAQLMGGDVGVKSRPGEGACFWVELELPLAAAPHPHPHPHPKSTAAHNLQGLRVLLVEDNVVNMLIGVAMLERWGVQVVQAHDGAQAVQALRDAVAQGQHFDLVLMDLQMPVMSGYEATREIRRLSAAGELGGPRPLPIIALTAAALVSEREQAREAGMDDFLTKPIDADRLRLTLGRWAAAH